MQNFSQLKQEFLKKWIEGLKICSSTSKNMGILERKNAINLSADLAMALARKGRTSWSRAVIARASGNNNNDTTVMKNASKQSLSPSKKIRKRSLNVRRVLLKKKSLSRKALPNSVAKRLVKKRTQILKRLVPGGDQCLDETSLIRETLDYIISLQAQVDVMRVLLGPSKTN